MLMILLGVVFDRAALGERTAIVVASGFVAGSAIFPLGVLLQTFNHNSTFGVTLAIAGSILVTVALAAVAIGFARQSG